MRSSDRSDYAACRASIIEAQQTTRFYRVIQDVILTNCPREKRQPLERPRTTNHRRKINRFPSRRSSRSFRRSARLIDARTRVVNDRGVGLTTYHHLLIVSNLSVFPAAEEERSSIFNKDSGTFIKKLRHYQMNNWQFFVRYLIDIKQRIFWDLNNSS